MSPLSLRAAAGAVDITPTGQVYLAGYGANRPSSGTHDPLFARCLVLDDGDTRIAVVACDVISISRLHVQTMRAEVTTVRPEHLFVSATHTHSGPDTLGQWGPDPIVSGVDDAWMARLRASIVTLVDETAAKLEPAALKFATTPDGPAFARNFRIVEVIDRTLSVMQAISTGTGAPIATLANFACHPEMLNCDRITADFPHWYCERVEREVGGVAMFVNGALGAMISPDNEEDEPYGARWDLAETMGSELAASVLNLVSDAEPLDDATISTGHRSFQVRMENEAFLALIDAGIYPSEVLRHGLLTTEVNRIAIGPAEILTLPGEVAPNIAIYLRRHMTGSPKFLFGLTNDELGYILTKEDWGLDLYTYETSVSVCEEVGSLMVENLMALVG